MSWSLGEVRSLASKAARGAGLEWGLADDMAFACIWLQKRGSPGLERLTHYLEQFETHGTNSTDPALIAGKISDLGDWRGVFPASVIEPLLLVPAIALTLGDDRAVLSWDGCQVFISSTALKIDGDISMHPAGAVNCDLSVADVDIGKNRILDRVETHLADKLAVLEKFARRTYAPPTEASRNSGAGAGNDGND